jgi:ATP-dependent DNA ligase
MTTDTDREQYVNIAGIAYAIMKSSPVIEAEGKTGKKFWQGHVVRSPAQRFWTCTSSWKATKGGTSKVVWSEPYYAEPKNIGRSNETTNYEQAVAEFNSMVQKERDKRESVKPLPMLAATFSKRKDKLQFPCFIQRKYDGMRVLYDGDTAWSRGNKEVIPEVFEHLNFETQGYIVDGELLFEDNQKVNEVMSAAKKFRKGVSDKLIYVLYDLVEPEKTYEERLQILTALVDVAQNPNVRLAPTYAIANIEDGMKCHKQFTDEGFEGSIWRNMGGKYAINKRVDDLQKHKDFIDEEFEIIDVIPSGGGVASEVGKFVCKAKNGDEFESTATGTFEQRKEYLVNKHKYIGKFAKVKYRELTAYGVPFHSNVLEVRETRKGGF